MKKTKNLKKNTMTKMNSNSNNYKPEKINNAYNKLTITILYPNTISKFAEASDFIDVLYEAIENLSCIGYAGIATDEELTESEFFNELQILETDSHYYIPYQPTIEIEPEDDEEDSIPIEALDETYNKNENKQFVFPVG